MKYKDSIPQAHKKMALAIQQLEEWNIPSNPINYTISYHYISGSHDKLIRDINLFLKSQDTLDDFFIEEIYRQYILGKNLVRDDLVNDLDQVITQANEQCQTSTKSVKSFIQQINHNLSGLQSTNKKEISRAISSIYQASNQLKLKQENVAEQMAQTQLQTEQLKAELDEIRKEVFLDPLTGLYNRKALNKHIETWVSEDPNQNIAAIVVNIDHFQQFNRKFGPLIGNVLLSKVAKKVRSYVGESGLPVRTAGDEFLILLPGVEQTAASEIAEKIRHGVEKLRFISSKTGVRLPQMTISLGVNEFKVKNNIQGLLAKTRILLKGLKNKHHNHVVIA